MPPQTRYTKNGDVTIAYETFGDPGGAPLLGIMGLDFQMVWWPDAFCQALADRGFAVARFDNRDTGLSTHFSSDRRENPFGALLGRTKPAYTTRDMLGDALAVMDALGWESAHVLGGSMGGALAQALAVYHPSRVRSLISCFGVPADAGPLQLLRYIKFGPFRQFRTLRADDSRESQIELLVSIFRVFASPGYPFPERWVREAAAISHDRSPRDPTSTQRQLAAGRAQKIPPISRHHRAGPRHRGHRRPADQAQGQPGHGRADPRRPAGHLSRDGAQPARGAVAADHRRDLRHHRGGRLAALTAAPAGISPLVPCGEDHCGRGLDRDRG